jgi:hypothetical protein
VRFRSLGLFLDSGVLRLGAERTQKVSWYDTLNRCILPLKNNKLATYNCHFSLVH